MNISDKRLKELQNIPESKIMLAPLGTVFAPLVVVG
jgi:hypothetical protein